MKRITLVIFLSLVALQGFSQRNNIVGVFVGGGCATSNNYDVALNGGLDLGIGLSNRRFFGFELLYQQYSLYYDNEANSARHGMGYAGETLRHKSSYFFFAPKFSYGLGRTQNVKIYGSIGIGMKMSGFDSVRRWDHSYWQNGYGYFDTTTDESKNIKGMVLRIGLGSTQYLAMGKHWRFTFTEDFGLLPGALTTTGDLSDPNRTKYSAQKLNPAYISLRIGISHTRFP